MTRTSPQDNGNGDESNRSTVYELDEIDRQILGALAIDARNASSPEIAEKIDVTPPTVRNRISKLESNGVIEDYDPRVDYQRLGFLQVLFVCTVLPDGYRTISHEVGQLPSVIQTRVVHSGSHNLHVVAIADGQNQITAIQNELAEFDIEIESISLIDSEETFQFSEFGSTQGSNHVKP